MKRNHLLINKYLENTISMQERDALRKWVLDSEENTQYFKEYVKRYSYETSPLDFDWNTGYNDFLKSKGLKQGKRLYVAKFFKYAAVIVVLISVGFFLINKSETTISSGFTEDVVNTDFEDSNDIIIKLADGTLKVLDTSNKELIKDKNDKQVAEKSAGLISFVSNDSSLREEVYSEIYVPFGKMFNIKLSDGTKVSLNAGSKLKFPQNFIASQDKRIVYLEGEAYFDVAKNPEKPFIVNTNKINVKVYGTQFNVSSYDTDNFVSTTLVEGSVSVYEKESETDELFIKPSYQATYDKTKDNFSNLKVDTDLYTAWTQNRFVINRLTFSDILIKLERLHNVKFINRATHLNNEVFTGEFQKENISTILKTMASINHFSYTIDGDVIILTK